MTSGGETEPAAEQKPGAPPQVFTNPNVTPTQQTASPSTDDSKTPAVSTKKIEPVVVQLPPTKPRTTAKRKSKRHRSTRATH